MLQHSHTGQPPLMLLHVLAAALLGAACIVLGAALFAATSLGLILAAAGLVLAAASCWQIRHSIAKNLGESQAWAEVTLLRSMLDQRQVLWSALPAPMAAWDGEGQLVMATAAWQRLGLSTDIPPDRPELSVGEPPRIFVVERAEPSSDVHVVLLREVTRERQALQAKDELLAVVGHELRTPLSSIKGYGQLMARQLTTVQEQVQRLDELIGDVLDTARADTGRLELRREPLSVRDIVHSACERFAAAHPGRALETNLEADAVIEGDAARLSQVIDNLLSNAAKYSSPESPISVQSAMDGSRVRISVCDQGIGIAPEHLPRLFDRFYRVPSDPAGAPAGFGLGLSIVRDLVEAHGGTIQATSRGRGSGSTFIVVLPITLPLEHQPDDTHALASG